MCRNVLTFVESEPRLSSVPVVYQPVDYFVQESLNEESSSHVLACTACCADSYFGSAGDRWNRDHLFKEPSVGGYRGISGSTTAPPSAPAGAVSKTGQLGTSESRERSGGWSFENSFSDRSWTAT